MPNAQVSVNAAQIVKLRFYSDFNICKDLISFVV